MGQRGLPMGVSQTVGHHIQNTKKMNRVQDCKAQTRKKCASHIGSRGEYILRCCAALVFSLITIYLHNVKQKLYSESWLCQCVNVSCFDSCMSYAP